MKQSILFVMFILTIGLAANPVWEDNIKVRGSVALDWDRQGVTSFDGGMLYIWSDTAGTDRDIKALRVGPLGNALWAEPRIIDDKTGIQKDPVIVATTDGNYIVAWIDTHDNPDGDIMVQKIDPNCGVIWQQGGIPITDSDAREYDLRLTPDNMGGAILTWSSQTDADLRSLGQSISCNGTLNWTAGGIDLTQRGYYLITSQTSDNNNGIMFCYSTDYDSVSRVFLNRFTANGVPAWAAPDSITDGVNMFRARKLCNGGDYFYFSWYQYMGNYTTTYLQKYAVDGTALWTEPVNITGTDLSIDMVDMIYNGSDNSIVTALVRYDESNSLILQKFNSMGIAQWGTGVIVEPALLQYFDFGCVSMSSDAAGGVYVSWLRESTDNWYGVPYVQKLSSFGEQVWQTGGVPLSIAPGERVFPLMTPVQNELWVAWAAMQGDDHSICFQKLQVSGVPAFEANGRVLYGGLKSMWTESKMTLSRSGDCIVLWEDDRYDESTSQIYAQVVNPNGTFDFAPNGVPVTSMTYYSQFLSGAQVLEDDCTLVLWMEGRASTYQLYAQMLDVNGNRLWGEQGVRISNNVDGWVSGVKVSEEDGAIFVVYSNYYQYGGGYISDIFAQKIVNGQCLWSDGGVDLVADTDICDNRFVDLDGRFVLYSKRFGATGAFTQAYVQHFSAEDGAPEIGWSEIGNPVTTGSGVDVWSRQGRSLEVRPEGVFVLYLESSQELGHTLMAQLFDLEGHYLFPVAGEVVLLPPNYLSPLIVSYNATDFTMAWGQGGEVDTEHYYQRFNYNPEPITGAIFLNDYGFDSYNTNLLRFGNGTDGLIQSVHSYDSQVIENAAIRYIFITTDGNPFGADPVHTIALPHRYIYNLNASVLNDNALLTWSDGSSFWAWKDEPIEHTNIWAQLIHNVTTAADDPSEVHLPAPKLYPNYPNPFNPTTTFSFSLPYASAAELAVYNSRGQLVRTLKQGELTAGTYNVSWDGTDDQGQAVASGVYLYRLKAGSETSTRRMVLLK